MDQAFNFDLNHQIVSSPSPPSSSCHIFFNPTQDLYHHHPEVYYEYHGGSSCELKTKVNLSLWKKEEVASQSMLVKDGDQVKWLMNSSANLDVNKLKVKMKMKPNDLNSSFNCNSPIRVCSDCHTTKTPLWRSGPKGPKSLCNACGIRQRKARRAMAAAAVNGGMREMKMREKMGKSGHLKKHSKMGVDGSSSRTEKKMDFEDFLINLSNKFAFHRVFPQDEKEAAILLMALSSGLVHG